MVRPSFKRWLRDQRGQSLIPMVFFFIMVLSLLGLAVDAGHLYFKKRKLQNALDAALISVGNMVIQNVALSANVEEVTRLTDEMLRYNLTRKGGIPPNGVILNTTYDNIEGLLHMDAAYNENTFLAPLFHGTNEAAVAATGEYGYKAPQPIIAGIAMDGSGSMSARDKADIKAAAKNFVDKMALGSYLTVVSFEKYYLVDVPITEVECELTSQCTNSKEALKGLIDNAFTSSPPPGGKGGGSYYEGGIYKLRERIISLRPALTSEGTWDSFGKFLIIAGDGNANVMDQESLTLSPYHVTNINQIVDVWAPRDNHNYFGTGRAMAVQQGDFARDEGITVVSVCEGTNCRSTATDTDKRYIRATMKRIANDLSFSAEQPLAGQWFWGETAATTTTPNNNVNGNPHCTYGYYNKRFEDADVPPGEFHSIEDFGSAFKDILEDIAVGGEQPETGLVK